MLCPNHRPLFVFFVLCIWNSTLTFTPVSPPPTSLLCVEMGKLRVWLRSGDPSRCQASSRPSFGFASGKGLSQLTYLSPIQSQSLSTQRCCCGCWGCCGFRCVSLCPRPNFLLISAFVSLTFFGISKITLPLNELRERFFVFFKKWFTFLFLHFSRTKINNTNPNMEILLDLFFFFFWFFVWLLYLCLGTDFGW